MRDSAVLGGGGGEGEARAHLNGPSGGKGKGKGGLLRRCMWVDRWVHRSPQGAR